MGWSSVRMGSRTGCGSFCTLPAHQVGAFAEMPCPHAGAERSQVLAWPTTS